MLVVRGAMPHTPQANREEGHSVLRAAGGCSDVHETLGRESLVPSNGGRRAPALPARRTRGVGAHRHRSVHGTVAWVRVCGDGHAGRNRGGDQDVERAPLPRPPSGRGRSTTSASAGPWGSRAASERRGRRRRLTGEIAGRIAPGAARPGSLFWAGELIALPRAALRQGSRSS